MDQRTIEHVMQRAITAIARPCYFHIAEPNLIQPRPDGWWCIGTVRLVDESKEWQVYWHPELGRGWLWGIARLQPRRVMPRRFEPPDESHHLRRACTRGKSDPTQLPSHYRYVHSDRGGTVSRISGRKDRQ
jgi:hypothetical protein